MAKHQRVQFGGETVDRRTAEMLAEAERLANLEDPSIGRFDLTQGSFSHSVGASAGTHDGPGAFDMSTRGYSGDQKEIIGLALRKVGFASWLRRPNQGPWPEHWHGIAMGTEGLPDIAAGQVDSYLAGRSGLRGNARDTEPRPDQILTWEQYQEANGTADAGQSVPSEPSDRFDIDAGQGLAASPDTDADGLSDAFEKLAGSDATKADTDSDGLMDGYEAMASHTDPLSRDTDSDGTDDAAEIAAGTDPGRLPGIAGVVGSGVFAENVRAGVQDADADGLSDKYESLTGLDANSADTDKDGLDDASEAALGTDPTRADSDHDGMTDALEVRHSSDPLSATMGADGRSVPTTPWTAERAYQQRMAAQQADQQPDPASPAADAPADGTSSALHTFLKTARAQDGDPYVYGADPRMADRNPDEFDCSALTQWAANRAGVELPRIAEAQYMQAKDDDQLISVEEALRTPGALLFYFSKEPKGPLPAGDAHVAISLGDGRTIEARGRQYGVGEFSAKGRSFNYAAVIPGISDQQGQREYQAYVDREAGRDPMATATAEPGNGQAVATATGTAPADPYAIDDGNGLDLTRLPGAKDNDKDTDSDGLTDAFEKLAGTNRKKADSDNDGLTDGYEALASHTDPLNTDTDNDGTDDATEIATGSDPGRMAGHAGVTGSGAFAENVRDGVTDTDSDGLSDHAEKLLRTDAGKTDTDNDQLDDAAEIALGTNPTLADTDSDGISDGLEAQYGTDPLAGGSTLGTDPLAPGSTLGTGLTPGLDNGGLATPDPTTPDPTQPGTPEPATAGIFES